MRRREGVVSHKCIETCHTDKHTLHIYKRDVAKESHDLLMSHTYIWDMSRTYIYITQINTNHIYIYTTPQRSQMIQSCHTRTYETCHANVMSHTHMWDMSHINIWDMSHTFICATHTCMKHREKITWIGHATQIQMRYVTHLNERRTYIWDVTLGHMIESCHTNT